VFARRLRPSSRVEVFRTPFPNNNNKQTTTQVRQLRDESGTSNTRGGICKPIL
jgi:hypothetical protein